MIVLFNESQTEYVQFVPIVTVLWLPLSVIALRAKFMGFYLNLRAIF